MFLLSLLSGSLLVLPVAVTVGVYVGVEWQKIIHHAQYATGGLDGQTPIIQTSTHCEKFYGITPFPGRYTFNPNQWGASQNSGALCMNITTNSSVPVDDPTAAGFSATWQYPVGPEEEPVHAFPNVKLDLNNTFPIALANLSSLTLDVSWSYGLGNYIHNDTDNDQLTTAEVNANVALDMFLAADAAKSTNTTDASYEVMLWLGRWGAATQPIGLLEGSRATLTVNGTTFDLYYGDNSLNQRVFTWVAEANATDFTGDVAPFLQQLADNTGPTSADYLGYVAFGSEVLYSFTNVTFYVPTLAIDVQSTQSSGN